MTKETIGWHKNCLKNKERVFVEIEEQIQIQIRERDKLIADIIEYKWQIERAEKEGKKEFDKSRYNRRKYD